MSAPTAGALRHRLVLEAPVRTDADGGTAELAWNEVGEVWGRIVPATGREIAFRDGLSARLTHEITLRHADGVHPRMRLRLSERIFEIHAVIDQDERRRWLRCLCEEIVA